MSIKWLFSGIIYRYVNVCFLKTPPTIPQSGWRASLVASWNFFSPLNSVKRTTAFLSPARLKWRVYTKVCTSTRWWRTEWCTPTCSVSKTGWRRTRSRCWRCSTTWRWTKRASRSGDASTSSSCRCSRSGRFGSLHRHSAVPRLALMFVFGSVFRVRTWLWVSSWRLWTSAALRLHMLSNSGNRRSPRGSCCECKCSWCVHGLQLQDNSKALLQK